MTPRAGRRATGAWPPLILLVVLSGPTCLCSGESGHAHAVHTRDSGRGVPSRDAPCDCPVSLDVEIAGFRIPQVPDRDGPTFGTPSLVSPAPWLSARPTVSACFPAERSPPDVFGVPLFVAHGSLRC